MREIKFRGKDTTGKWQYGSLLKTRKMIFICKPLNKTATRNYYIENVNTIGQYTGLKDKNGQEIFEDDIVEFEDDIFEIQYDEGTAMFVLKNIDLCITFDNVYSRDLEVIGNLYDNPELLGEGE